MTSLIRSARVALESKTVPVPNIPAEVRKIQVQTRLPEQAPYTPPVAVPTYEEYKQRLGAELAELRQRTIDTAREQGLQQGRQMAEEQFKRQLQALRALIESIRGARQQYIEDVGDDATQIVLVAVSKILGAAFEKPDAAVAAVREAIRGSNERGRLCVRVAPEDFELLDAHRDELLAGMSSGAVELIADAQVEWGGCLLEGSAGGLDARLETQLQRLRDTLLRVRAKWGETDA